MSRVINFPLKAAVLGTDDKVNRKLNDWLEKKKSLRFFEEPQKLLEDSKSQDKTFFIYILDLDVERFK